MTIETMPRGRLKWLCRRGMKEHDVLFERYLAKRYDLASSEEQADFVRFASLEDPEVNALLTGRMAAPDEGLRHLINTMVELRD